MGCRAATTRSSARRSDGDAPMPSPSARPMPPPISSPPAIRESGREVRGQRAVRDQLREPQHHARRRREEEADVEAAAHHELPRHEQHDQTAR